MILQQLFCPPGCCRRNEKSTEGERRRMEPSIHQRVIGEWKWHCTKKDPLHNKGLLPSRLKFYGRVSPTLLPERFKHNLMVNNQCIGK
eukprot:scaffold5281_cov115-Skeletonema_marinoi.AAC.3